MYRKTCNRNRPVVDMIQASDPCRAGMMEVQPAMRAMTCVLLALAVSLGCGTGPEGTDAFDHGSPGDDLPDVQQEIPGDTTEDANPDTTLDSAIDGNWTDSADDDGGILNDTAADDGDDNGDIGDTGPTDFVRPPRGEPVDSVEIGRITDLYLEILEKTRYFDVMNERVHGWPRDDAGGRYWYGTWWSGITMTKTDGMVTFLHSPDGADNNGMRGAPMLVGTCFASRLWGKAEHVALARKLVRGFNSWAYVFRSPTHPDWEAKQVLSRAAYPESVETHDDGLHRFIDYSKNRPGEDNGACEYVEVTDNPYWGHIFAKNKRSKDDIGHMFIALALMNQCIVGQDETDPEVMGLMDDIEESMEIYRNWAAQVDEDGWKIATVDKAGTIYYPDEDLAYLWLEGANIECEAAVTLRLFGGGNPDDLACGNGINPYFGEEDALKNDFHQIQRSFHEAAIMHSWVAGRGDVATELLDGLAWRLDTRLDELESLEPPEDPHLGDLGELVLMAGNSGLPLTWREVRFLHARIEESYNALVGTQDQAALKARFDVFSPDVADGTYPFDPGDAGMAWRYLGAILGVCASPFWSSGSMQVLDCEKIRQATM